MFKSNEPLGLPHGSVRALMTICLLLTVCVLCVMRQPVPDILQQAFLVSLGLYYGGRAAGKTAAIPVEETDDSETK